jgi:hypothetical protein
MVRRELLGQVKLAGRVLELDGPAGEDDPI